MIRRAGGGNPSQSRSVSSIGNTGTLRVQIPKWKASTQNRSSDSKGIQKHLPYFGYLCLLLGALSFVFLFVRFFVEGEIFEAALAAFPKAASCKLVDTNDSGLSFQKNVFLLPSLTEGPSMEPRRWDVVGL